MMRVILTGAALAVLMGASSPVLAQSVEAAAVCAPVQGLPEVLGRPGLRYLVMGEIHGTAEAPAVFGDLVCAAAATRSVVVGVEWPASSQPMLDAFLSEADEAVALKRLMEAPAWKRADGRDSRAMLQMLIRVRELDRKGGEVSLAAFDFEIPAPGTSDERERSMADLLIRAGAARPDALVVALTGMGHADRDGFTSMQPPVQSMAQHLPAEASATLALARSGGEAWMCRTTEGVSTCGPVALTTREEPAPRGLVAPRSGFDAILSIGGPLTPSEPARPR